MSIVPDPVVLTNATVYDGSGGPPHPGSVVIGDGRVQEVVPGAPVESASAIDLAGWAVAPGFIDSHTHSDVSLLSDPDCVSAVYQGVTSQIVGHCGFSAAPTDEVTRSSLQREEPVFGFPGRNGAAADWGWDSVAEYLETVEAARPRTNVGTLVGHNTLRRMVVGSANRPPTDDELDRMVSLAASAIADGALGLSTGLSYAPGRYAEPDEITAMARASAQCGRRHHTHMRYGDTPIAECVREAIQSGRAAECAVNISHLYPAVADPPGTAELLLAMIDEENQSGGDVTFDLTLFRRGGGAWSQSLPAWAVEGGADALVERIRGPGQRRRLVAAIERICAGRNWDDDLIVKVTGREAASVVGRTIGAIAQESQIPPAEAAVRLLELDAQFWVAPTIKRQSDLDTLLRHRRCVPVTDGMAAHPQRHGSLGLMPKTFGTFPLLLGDYVRSRGVLTLAEAIARVTAVPAERFGLSGRGLVRAGYRADLVVFDPDTIANCATDADPGRAPVGIKDVMVNGSWAVRNGRLTPQRNGEVLT